MNFSKKQTYSIIIGAIVIALVFFFIGTAVGKHHAPINTRGGQYGMMGQGGGMRPGMNGGMMRGAGLASGTILSQDATSITIAKRDGGSQIILISPSTSILKTAPGAVSDLKTGDDVMINGASNADGSIAAQSISIRPTLPKPTTTN